MKNKTKTKGKKSYFLHDLIWGVAWFLGLFWFRPKNYYINDNAKKKIKGGAILIANHIGFYDPVYMMMTVYYRRHHFIATKELFDGKFKKFLFEKIFLCICIDRDNVGSKTMHTIVDVLKEGELVSMFPEGQIKTDESEKVSSFKSGMVLMALKSGAPIIPMYIQKRKNIFKRLKVVIGEPVHVSVEGMNGSIMEYLDSVAVHLRDKELELEKYYENHIER